MLPYLYPLYTPAPPTALIYLSHSHIEPKILRQLRLQAKRYQIPLYLYPQGLLSKDFAKSLLLTRRRRLGEEGAAALDDDDNSDNHNNNNNNNNNNDERRTNNNNDVVSADAADDDDDDDDDGDDVDDGDGVGGHHHGDDDGGGGGNNKGRRRKAVEVVKRYKRGSSDNNNENNENNDQHDDDDDFCRDFVREIIHTPSRQQQRQYPQPQQQQQQQQQRRRRRREPSIPRSRIQHWAKYLTLTDKPMKRRGFLASDPLYAAGRAASAAPAATAPSLKIDTLGGRAITRSMLTSAKNRTDAANSALTTTRPFPAKTRKRKKRAEDEEEEEEEEGEMTKEGRVEEDRRSRKKDAPETGSINSETLPAKPPQHDAGEKGSHDKGVSNNNNNKNNYNDNNDAHKKNNNEQQHQQANTNDDNNDEELREIELSNIRKAAKERIDTERAIERDGKQQQQQQQQQQQRLDNICFPENSVCLIDDFMLCSAESSSNKAEHNNFRAEITETYKTLTALYSR